MTTLLRIAIAIVLLAAGIGKLSDPAGFVLVLRSYRFFPVELLWPAAVAIIATEMFLGIWLIWGRQLYRAAQATVALHTLYSAFITFMLLRGKPILNCGCFGARFARPLSWQTLGENLILVGLSVALFLLCRRNRKMAETSV